VSKNESAENDTMRNIKRRSRKKTENDTTAKSWKRNCPKCNKEILHKSKSSRDNSVKYGRYCWSCRNSGENNPFYGKKHTVKHKKYISEVAPSRRPEVKAKISKANKGKVIAEDTKQKLRDATNRQFSTPESRKMHGERVRRAYDEQPELRERASELAKRQYEQYKQTDEYQHWLSKKSEYELYKMEVLRLTFENDLTVLDNWSKRNLYHKYEVDHIYPIRQAFKHSIPSNLIGDIRNLRIIPRGENRSKSGKVTIIPEHIQLYLKEVTVNE
jgi:predicted RNA-binding Zn-ribbon protein involved in translation (DUF1610 family)